MKGIDAQRWSEVRVVFDELVDLDGTNRRDRLAILAASDPDLCGAVTELLAADAEADVKLSTLDAALIRAAARAPDQESDADPLHLAGSEVSHFRIHEPLASGGMGVVYRAEDVQLHRPIALKFPLPAASFGRSTRERFMAEARAAAALDHPNICSIHEVGETTDGQLFIAMPLYDGETLKARLSREGPLDLQSALTIARHIAAGLGAAHRSGIVHRDIKPANVMLLRDGSVKVLDFGVAKARELGQTQTDMRVGTVSYMAPEQILGRPVDARADLWALGATLYEMLTGRRPFDGEYDVSIAHAIIHADPVAPSNLRAGLSGRLNDFVLDLLSKDPAQRYANADDVAAELDAIRLDTTGHANFRGSLRSLRRRVQVSSNVLALGVAILIVATLAAVLMVQRAVTNPKPARTLAILPFADSSTDSRNEYLAVGLGAAIGTELSRLQSLIVPSYMPMSDYAGTAKTPTEIGRELNAAAVLRGSVAASNDRVQVAVTLFDAGSGKPIWSQHYDRPAAELLQIQRDILRAVTKAMRLDLSRDESATLMRLPTENSQAFDLYLQGLALEQTDSPGSLADFPQERTRALQSTYARARDIDPNFALARARLALAQVYGALQYDSTNARFDQVRLEAEAALRLRPGLAEAHEALAWHWGPGRGDHRKSIEHSQHAVEAAPNRTDYHSNLGTSYRTLGLWNEAVAAFDRAMQLEPRSPGPAMNAATTYSRLRRYDQAVNAWNRAIQLKPDAPDMKVIRGQVFLRWHGVVDTLEKVLREHPEPDPNGMRTLARHLVASIKSDHVGALRVLDASHREVSVDAMSYRLRELMRAQSYIALGEDDRARRSFERAHRMLADTIGVRPQDPRLHIAQGIALAGLGRKEEAARAAQRGLTLAPLAADHPLATAMMAGAAEVYARAGYTTEAFELLELLLTMPAGREVSVPLLRVDPAFSSLRSDPRFEPMLRRFAVSAM